MSSVAGAKIMFRGFDGQVSMSESQALLSYANRDRM